MGDTKFLRSAIKLGVVATALFAAIGCSTSPVGDPCIPERIPEDGFDSRETYLETSSVQCRTRLCMVYQLDGNPEKISGEPSCPAGDPTCVSATERDSQVFCSCRCRAPEGASSSVPLCDCGDGFECKEDVVTTGNDGVRGDYCVPCIRPDDDRNLDPTIFQNCPED